MAQIYIQYNPYRLETTIKIDGQEILPENKLYQCVDRKRLRDWVDTFLKLLKTEFAADEHEIQFNGTEIDWEYLEEAFHRATNRGLLSSIIQGFNSIVSALKGNKNTASQKSKIKLSFKEIGFNLDMGGNILDYFLSARDSIVDNCKDTELKKAINKIRNPIGSIYVIGAAGAGKSTLINALLRNRIMPCQSVGCTITMVELFHEKNSEFTAMAWNEEGELIEETDAADYDKIKEYNNLAVDCIKMQGKIPFLRLDSTMPVLVDTPNVHFMKNQKYQDAILNAIHNDDDCLILYVLDGARLYEDTEILHSIAEQMKKGGKQTRSRFLFVLNKMDTCNPEEEKIDEVIASARSFLYLVGIKDPQIFPCSAFTALNIRTTLKNVDINKLTRESEKQLATLARDTIPMIDKLTRFESMHLEQYAKLPTAAQKDLDSGIQQANQREDIKMQAMIHSGIHSIEAYIVSYMKKYMETKRTKDLIETFHAYHQHFIDTNSFKILVTATMSAGKSTFINALAGKNICLSRNMACTSKLHSIVSKPFDTDFTFEYDYALSLEANKEKEPEIANKTVVRTVYYNGILAGQRLIINDSPGVNFSGDAEHQQITNKMIAVGNYQLMIYLMNATQLGTNDDDAHLDYVKKHIGGQPVLFVMNKVDAFNEDEEDIESIALKQIRRLEAKGFHDPLVCPVSARAGFLAKKAEEEEPGRMERRELNNMVDKFEQMNIVDYYTKYYPELVLPDSEDEDKQLLKTCGISYVETIIKTICEGGCVHGTSIR